MDELLLAMLLLTILWVAGTLGEVAETLVMVANELRKLGKTADELRRQAVEQGCK